MVMKASPDAWNIVLDIISRCFSFPSMPGCSEFRLARLIFWGVGSITRLVDGGNNATDLFQRFPAQSRLVVKGLFSPVAEFMAAYF